MQTLAPPHRQTINCHRLLVMLSVFSFLTVLVTPRAQAATGIDLPNTVNEISHCHFDQKTALLWELKSAAAGLQYFANTYSWYETNRRNNGGEQGIEDGGHCTGSRCDTSAYVDALNQIKLCGRNNWRLPTREELRSIVDYRRAYPGPTVDSADFPLTMNQFYWSATPSALEPDSAWGIGFAFGYDYAYSKSHAAPVRLVSDIK